MTRHLVLGYVDKDAARQLESVPLGLLTVEALITSNLTDHGCRLATSSETAQ